ncbi:MULTISPECIES: helix-turn-helix transcriptional regulator [Ruminococcus]|uniref:helix-turn-helix transcriptional regulator n=1 Tax=Ruminococcus TaxID=1263 RepID=UPI003966B106
MIYTFLLRLFSITYNWRLRNAAYMIKNTSDSINAICGLCGFDDHSYFSKAFKEAYGCSPRDFRK